jgi:hypothetical protein
MCKCDLYEKGDSENEQHNNHFALYFAIIVLNIILGFQSIWNTYKLAIRFFYDPHFEA